MKLGPNQRKWIRALRSGKFRKGTRYLRTEQNRYCCLGVACEVLAPETHELDEINQHLYDGELYSLSDKMVRKLGLRDNSGCPKDEMNYMTLTTLNDDKHKSHKQIADILVKHKEQYFRKSV